MKRSAWRYLWKSEDIRKKLLITLLILVIYRLAANIPVPGINREVIRGLFEGGATSSAGGDLIGLLDLLAGGTISTFSVLAMGVYPYITAQIIIQLLAPIIPALERRMRENPTEWRKTSERWTVMLTVPMALLSAFGQIGIFNSMAASGNILTYNFGIGGESTVASLTTIISMVGGTMFGIWLGQLISEYGIPNQGLSLIIFAGIVSRIPSYLGNILTDTVNGWWLLLVILAILGLTIFAIVFVQQGRRHVPVLFPGRRVGNRMSMPVKSQLPLMVNMAGMIPLIFAQALLTFPGIIGSFFQAPAGEAPNFGNWLMNTFGGSGPVYAVLYFLLVVIFTFFYTSVLFDQQNYGDNLKKQGAQVPGIVRGAPTQKYLSRVQRRITLPGALFLGFVAVLPFILQIFLPISGRSSGLLLISAAGLLIVVGVVRDTFNIIDAELKLHGYDESLIKG